MGWEAAKLLCARWAALRRSFESSATGPESTQVPLVSSDANLNWANHSLPDTDCGLEYITVAIGRLSCRSLTYGPDASGRHAAHTSRTAIGHPGKLAGLNRLMEIEHAIRSVHAMRALST
jgi:hypothetical protein